MKFRALLLKLPIQTSLSVAPEHPSFFAFRWTLSKFQQNEHTPDDQTICQFGGWYSKLNYSTFPLISVTQLSYLNWFEKQWYVVWNEIFCYQSYFLLYIVLSLPATVNNRDGSRIPRIEGRQLTILPYFPKNCMKLKEFGPGGHPSRPYLDPPLVTVNKLFTKLRIVNNYISVCLLMTVKWFATNSTMTLKYILKKSMTEKNPSIPSILRSKWCLFTENLFPYTSSFLQIVAFLSGWLNREFNEFSYLWLSHVLFETLTCMRLRGAVVTRSLVTATTRVWALAAVLRLTGRSFMSSVYPLLFPRGSDKNYPRLITCTTFRSVSATTN